MSEIKPVARAAGREVMSGKWYRWPEDKRTGRVAWFVVAWRLLWVPLIYSGFAIGLLGTLLAYGAKDAERLWRSL